MSEDSTTFSTRILIIFFRKTKKVGGGGEDIVKVIDSRASESVRTTFFNNPSCYELDLFD